MSTDAPVVGEALSATAELLREIKPVLALEGWAETEVRDWGAGTEAAAFAHSGCGLLLVVHGDPGLPPIVGLDGKAAGSSWSAQITEPTADQILVAACAAAETPDTKTDLTGALAEAGWVTAAPDNGPCDGTVRTTSADGRRTLIQILDTPAEPGGWVLEGDGLCADATGDTPQAVVLALALS